MIRIGVLSDTHINRPLPDFAAQVQKVFIDCSVILHAGDLTDLSILEVFAGKTVHAVHGNMCTLPTQQTLPSAKLIQLDGYSIGLCHGAGARHNIEERMWNLFPTADCIVYGHSHHPVCHLSGKTLFLNPGSFQGTGRHGAPGSYAILSIDNDGLHGSLHQLDEGWS
ncbi:MAG: metallophosphatase family protein [Proteobacteria bacterium]|nr:metallophosphatase family protein [Pseudomonadota bacterium]MBU1060157.1 metallophosphatase family protein [Pseudomonadota bacterium]